MFKTKLIDLFYQLSKLERNSLVKFARSPYLQTREDVLKLFEYLNSSLEKSKLALDKKMVFKQVYPKEPYKDRKIYDLTTLAFLTLEDFLGLEEYKKNKHQNLLALSNAYQNKGLFEYSKKTITRLKKNLQKQSIQDSHHYFQQYQFKYNEYLQHHHLQQQRNAPIYLQEVTRSLDTAYIAEKLKQACLIIAHQAMYNSSYDTGLLSFILTYIQECTYCLEQPAIGIYYYCYQALANPQNGHFFQQFKQLILTHIDLFPKEEIRDLYLLAINYCIKAFNNGQQIYLDEVFELYQQALTKYILLQKGQLSAFAFKNIIGISLKLNKLDWTAQFIETYQNYLAKDIQETYVHYAISKLSFAKKDYTKALLLLQQVEYTDLFLSIDTKIMLLKIYYELEEHAVLDSFLSSFNVFLQRKKLIGYHKENYLNIIKLTQKLLTVNTFDKDAILALQQQIQNTPRLSEQEWLLDQLSKL